MKQFTDNELYEYIQNEWICPVDVDFENFDIVHSEDFQDGRLALFFVGGDWQWPVHFVAVRFESGFGIYLPDKGNVYHKEDMVAYETEDYEDYPLEDADYDLDAMIAEAKEYFTVHDVDQAVLWLSINAPGFVLDWVRGLME